MFPLPEELKNLKPILRIEAWFPHTKRIVIKEILAALSLILFALWIFSLSRFSPAAIVLHSNLIEGLFLILFAVFLKLAVYECFFYSTYMKAERVDEFSYELGDVLLQSDGKNDDAVNLFLLTRYGRKILRRLDISMQDVVNFISLRQSIVLQAMQFEAKPQHDISNYASWLFDNDKAFADFLFAHQVQKNQLVGAASWIEREYLTSIEDERWWSKEKLDRIQGLGKNWAYGETYLLDRYAVDVTEKNFSGKEASLKLMSKEASDLEIILSRGREANAIIISDDEGERVSLIETLAEKIQSGTAQPLLEHKRIYLFHGQSVLEANQSKEAFETEWQKLLNQTLGAGNIILVIDDFAGFIHAMSTLGSNFLGLISPFLASSTIQIIGFANNKDFHSTIESNQSLLQHFETLRLATKDTGYLFELLKDEALVIEKRQGVFFTYQSLEEIVTDAARYFSGVQAVEKILDLLTELVPRAYANGRAKITKEDVLELIQTKTGVPVSGVKSGAEKEKLLNLESILHERIVGQEDAVSAISQAMRRARSGLANATRPLGSFLFLGPTGVGKTETAKALDDVFFGSDSPMIRFDMSEYAGGDGLAKLIGSFGSGGGTGSGNLVNALREHQYGVLLLDEFEKANEEVHNLFLQILDEGNFSDAKGEKVNARNLIIIATSNAGSTMIFDLLKNNAEMADSKDAIMESIIHDRVFKPELLNRFDGVIVFHPLGRGHLEQIARLKLGQLVLDLRKKGYDLATTDSLIAFLVNKGFDEKFGARPMNRAIADEIEEAVAKSILKNELVPGSRFELIKDPNSGHLAVSKIA